MTCKSQKRSKFIFLLNSVYKIDGETFVVDPVSFDLIVGSKVDYVDELIGSSFVVADNPKAESSCGCKISFNIKD